MKGNGGIGPAARNIFINRLANARLELGQIAWQIDHNVALLPVHGIEFDAKFCPAVIGLAATVAGHASHTSGSFSVEPEGGATSVTWHSIMVERGYALRESFAKKLCSLKRETQSVMHAL